MFVVLVVGLGSGSRSVLVPKKDSLFVGVVAVVVAVVIVLVLQPLGLIVVMARSSKSSAELMLELGLSPDEFLCEMDGFLVKMLLDEIELFLLNLLENLLKDSGIVDFVPMDNFFERLVVNDDNDDSLE